PGGELHASGSSWSKELVAHRQPTSGTEGCGDSLGRGKLPSAASPGARLLFHDSPRACRSPDPVPSRPYSRCVGRPAFIDSSDRGLACSDFGTRDYSFLSADDTGSDSDWVRVLR